MDSIYRKCISLHRKKIPTGDPNMPLDARMTKKVKYKIRDKAELDDGTEEYDMLENMIELGVRDNDNTNYDDSSVVGNREHVSNTVMGDPVADDDILEPEDTIATTSNPARFSVRGLNNRPK